MAYLKGFSQLGESTLTNDIRNNLVSFFDYGLLEKGNFTGVTIPSTGVYGGSDHRLRMVKDPRFSNGQIWQAFRGNWVWESGIGAITSTDPAHPGVSGVYVNSTFYPVSTTGTYAHHIDHNYGQVVFHSPIPTGSVVECNFSYKYINVTQVDGLSWFEEVQKHARSDTSSFISQSGEYLQLADSRVQLPALGIQIANSRSLKPYQLGGGQTVRTDVFFYCVAEDSYIRDSMVDIVSFQNEATVNMYDLDAIASNNAFPINESGVPVSGALRYPDLLSSYSYGFLRLFDMKLNAYYELGNDIYVGVIKCSTEINLGV